MKILLKNIVWLHKKPGKFTFQHFLKFSLLLAIGFPFLASAQNVQWNKTIGADLNDYFTTATQTSDGGYILGGTSGSGKNGDKSQPKNGQSDFWIVKLNADGSKAWDKTIGSAANDRLDALQQTSDGGYILLGYSVGGASGDKTGTKENWVVKLKPDGTIAWDKTFGVQKGGSSLTELQQTSDGGYILGGSAFGFGGDKTEAGLFGDFWLVKLNADGSKAWDKTIVGNSNDNLTTLQQTKDGGFIVGGNSDSGKGRDKSEDQKNDGNLSDFWMVKLNPDRTIAWDKTIGVEADDLLSTIRQTPDGSYIVGGYADAGLGEFKSEKSKGGFDYWVIKLNNKGTQEWNKTIGGSNSDQLHALQPTSDGGYLLGGGSRSNNSGDKTQDNQGIFDYWVVKLNANGSKAWDLTLGGNAEDALENVIQTKDNGYLIGGYSKSPISGTKTEASKGGYDYWVVKLDNDTKAKQTISFAALPEVNFATQKTLSLKATASSGLPVTFRVVSGPATVKGNTVTFKGGSGTVTMEALQTGNAKYYAAPAVTQTFVVQVPPVTRLWNKSFGGIRTEYQSQGNECDKIFGTSSLTAMVRSSDGGYLLGGTSDSKKGNDKSDDHLGSILEEQCFSDQQPITDYWIVKTNANGEKLWDKTFGGNDRDELKAILATPDGGYLLGGSSKSNGNGNKTQASRGYEDYWIVKISANGNKIWDKTFGGHLGDVLTTLIATPDGNYLLGGTSISGKSGDKTEAGIGGQEFWIVKIDGDGNKIWDKAYDNEGNDLSTLQSIVPSSDGGFLLGGTTSIDKGNYWVVKINSQGLKLWNKSFGGDAYDNLSALANTTDGGYLLGGYSNSGKSGDKSEASRGGNDFWVVKIDEAGKKVWDETIGGNGSDLLSALIKTPDGGFLLGGTTNSGVSGEKSEEKRGLGDYWVIKIDFNGVISWDRTLGGTNNNEQLSSLLVTSDGNFLVGGSSYSENNGDKSQPLKGIKDFWVIKLKEEKNAPALAWDMRFGGSGTDNLTDVIKTSDGGYLAGGYSDSKVSGDKSQNSKGKNDYWIVKTDKNGKKLWDKSFGGSDQDYLNRVIQTQDGGYLLAGSSLSGKSGDKSQPSQGDRDFWIVKTDALGNKQWDKTYGGSDFDQFVKIIQLSTGEFVLGGTTKSPVNGDVSQNSPGLKDYWLVKISSTGTKIWDKRYGGNGDDQLGSFTETKEGGFLLAGSSYSGAKGDKSQTSNGLTDYWVVKLDKEGNKIWDKTFGSRRDDVPASVARSGSDFYIAGTNTTYYNPEQSPEGFSDKDYWLVKIDTNGNLLWEKTFGGKQTDVLQASTSLPDGGIVLGGSSYSEVSGSKSQPSQGSYDYWIVRVDANGNKVYDKTVGGSERDELRTIFSTSDGGLMLAGWSASQVSGDVTQPNQGSSDYWLVKLAPAPDTSSMLTTREATVTEAPVAFTNNLTAYPNPFQGKVNVKFSLPQTQAATVKIFDGQGKEVSTLFQGEVKAIQTYQLEWQAGNKPAGLYFIQLQTPTLRQQHKLLLTK
ncbi:T9SS type A sorting domain-containing protein [Adhaeribacter radiodurans]|uniref:T9SS type A sorting domain-containing protein n=1 Tax=Adhaeribacter radiodurans TaxID=2745197 RepID=A0A7L7L9Y0_9BACT|nr:T9SS type A sorting domain-containing protein [Adhaeribacter radiodurans]QMU29524.1 T9SS type A sorting domain-containing protein [Adhaeribacter radiodurans]